MTHTLSVAITYEHSYVYTLYICVQTMHTYLHVLCCALPVLPTFLLSPIYMYMYFVIDKNQHLLYSSICTCRYTFVYTVHYIYIHVLLYLGLLFLFFWGIIFLPNHPALLVGMFVCHGNRQQQSTTKMYHFILVLSRLTLP